MIWICAALALEPVEDAPFELHTATLDNGLEVLLQPRPDATSVFAMVVVRGGGRYENATTSGASHLLEHMLFTKTERWDEKEIRDAVEGRGGSYNGYTYAESVRYHAWLGAEELPVAVDWLDQVVFRSQLEEAQLHKEREVVFEERGGRDGWWMKQLADAGIGASVRRAASRAYWPETALAMDHIGEDASLDGMSLGDVEGFYVRHYRPDNAAVVLVGRFEVDEALARVEEAFAHVQKPVLPAPVLDEAPIAQELPREQTIWRPTVGDQVELSITVPTVGTTHPDHTTVELAGRYLGDLLFERLRTDRGLVYSAKAWNDEWSDAGFLRVETELDHIKVDEALGLMHAAMDEMAAGEIEPERLQRVRAQTKGQSERSLEEGRVRANRIAHWWLSPAAARELRPEVLWSASIEEITRVAAAWTRDRRTTWVKRSPLTITQAWSLSLGMIALGLGGFLVLRRRR